MRTRGKDKQPYGVSNRKPGRGRQAKHPWRTWLSSEETVVLSAEDGDFEDARRFKAQVAVRVSVANKKITARGIQGWVAHRCRLSGEQEVELSFWWYPGEGQPAEQSVPAHVQDFFARPGNAAPADRAAAASQVREQVEAAGGFFPPQQPQQPQPVPPVEAPGQFPVGHPLHGFAPVTQ